MRDVRRRGQWAYEVGVPAKSGVSGGILAVVPGKPGIGVFSPGLNVYGNSVRGWEADTWCMRWFLVVPLVWVG